MRRFKLSLFVLLFFLVLWRPSQATSIEFRTIEFKAGHPLKGEPFADAVNPPSETSYELLKNNLKLLAKIKDVRVSVLGFTDDRECTKKDCISLSLRRAQYIYDWLRKNGISTDRLSGPEGRGTAMAIDDNANEAGRQRNRRVELDLLPYEK